MNPEHLAALIDRHSAALALYAAQWTAAADDAVQEAFVRLIAEEPPPDRPLPWLYRVVRNLAVSDRRADVRRRRREAGVAGRLAMEGSSDVDTVEVADALERLDGPAREVVIAHLWGGLTFVEIAELTGLSTSAAHRQYQTALEALRKVYDKSCTNHTI